MQDLQKINITMEAMENEFNSYSVPQTKTRENVFDEKNYLNVRLSDNEDTKDLKIRLLPIDSNSQTPFKNIHIHTIKVSKDISNNPWKSYICIEKTEGIDREKYGHKCPFCELNREAYKNFTEAKDEITRERWKKISLDNIAKESCIVRCIERGAEEDGPKFWKFNIRKDKTDPKGQIMELYKTRKQESIEEGDVEENILDLRTGKDLKVTISQATDGKTGMNRTSVKVVDYGKNKPITTDEGQLAAWVNDPKKWHDVFAIKPYDYLKIILDGDVPYYDKNVNKWVSRQKYNDDKELAVETYNDLIAEYETEIIARPVVGEINNEVINGVPQTDNNDLPF